VVFPTHFAEGSERPEAALASPAEANSAAQPPSEPTEVPDPEPLRALEQQELVFAYAQGEVTLRSLRTVRHDTAQPTARRLGHWALECWAGSSLAERVRFEFPLVTGDPPQASGRHPLKEPARFGPGVQAEVTVRWPATLPCTRVLLVDRWQHRIRELPWPLAVGATTAATAGDAASPRAEGASEAPAPNGASTSGAAEPPGPSGPASAAAGSGVP